VFDFRKGENHSFLKVYVGHSIVRLHTYASYSIDRAHTYAIYNINRSCTCWFWFVQDDF
jgi:hypothetical protein